MPSISFPRSLHDALPISIVGPPQFLPSAAGRLLANEVEVLSTVRERPNHPFVAIMGGSKVSDKLGVIEALLELVDTLLVGGGRSEEHTSELQSPCNLVCRPSPSLVPYTTLFRSPSSVRRSSCRVRPGGCSPTRSRCSRPCASDPTTRSWRSWAGPRSATSSASSKPCSNSSTRCLSAVGDRKSTRLNSSHLVISYAVHLLPSFPTRRSSDLHRRSAAVPAECGRAVARQRGRGALDRARATQPPVRGDHGRVQGQRQARRHRSPARTRRHAACRRWEIGRAHV